MEMGLHNNNQGGGTKIWDENLYNNFLISEVTVRIVLSYYKSVKKLVERNK